MKSTIHWVSAAHAVDAEVRLYDNLFTKRRSRTMSGEGQDFTANLNPNSLEVLTDCQAGAVAGERPPATATVRTPGLLLRGYGFKAGQAGFQPHRCAEGHWAKIEKKQIPMANQSAKAKS